MDSQTQQPISDDIVEVSFLAQMAESSDVLLKQFYSEAATKAAGGVLLLSLAILAVTTGIVKPDKLSLGSLSFGVSSSKLLVLCLTTALGYLVWNLWIKVRTEKSIHEYRRAVAVSKLNEQLKPITAEVKRLELSGRLRQDGALREKNELLEELIAEAKASPGVAYRIAFIYPASIAAIATIFVIVYTMFGTEA